ncbi:MAG: ribonuclease III [Chlamydiae bacterium]|nr:ribonuclease III [Chlamydiota bacterium]
MFTTFLTRREEIEKILNYSFIDPSLLLLAFTHRSFVNENRKLTEEHNERLEFLGDAILGFMVSDFLYRHFPHENEGKLSQQKASLVDSAACALYMQKLDLGPYLLMGKGELLNEGKARETILSDAFEAMIGAIYIDGGLEKVKEFFWGHFEQEVLEILQKPCPNWKADLQDIVQRLYHVQPEYVVMSEEGPDHSKTFHVVVKVAGKEVGSGSGCTKKTAQQAAAQQAIEQGNI